MPRADLRLGCRPVCPVLLTAPGLWEKRGLCCVRALTVEFFKSSS